MHSNNVTTFSKQNIIVRKIKYLINMARTYLVAALLEALKTINLMPEMNE